MSKTLTAKALEDAARELGVELAAIRAVDEVESRGAGFTPDGKVKVLFERHKFHEFTKGRYDASFPNLSNPEAGGYGPGRVQYIRFSNAFELDKEAAMKATSWGRYQIMGFNYRAAGFKSVGDFVDAMKVSENEHLKAFVKVIESWGLAQELRDHNWASFARQYNGENYKKNRYDKKLAAAYARFKAAEKKTAEPAAAELVKDLEPQSSAPEEKKESIAEAVDGPPAQIEVKPPDTSLGTKIATAAGPVGTAATALGIKVGGVEFSENSIIALCAVFIVSLIVAAVLWDRSQARRWQRQELSIKNLADPTKANAVATKGE